MNKEQLDELARVDRDASPAPWWPYSQKERPARVRAGTETILEAPTDENGGIDETGRNNQADHNVLLTAAARNALARLLKEREMLLSRCKMLIALARKSESMGCFGTAIVINPEAIYIPLETAIAEAER